MYAKGKNRITTILIVFIVFLQLFTIFFWANRKANFYIDELYSMGYAHTFTGVSNDPRRIFDSSSWKRGSWCNIDDFKSQLVVHEDESVLSQSIWKTLSQTIRGRNYFALLNLSESLIFPGEISRWGGIALNMLIFILFQFSLLRFFRRLHLQDSTILAAMLMFGFSGYILSLSVYIRFYLLTNLLLLLTLHLHLIILEDRRPGVIAVAEIASILLMYLSFKNSELTLITSGSLIVALSLVLMIQRRWLRLICYSVPSVSFPLVYLLLNTHYIDVFLHPGSYSSLSGALGPLAANVTTTSPQLIISFFQKFVLNWIKVNLFARGRVMVSFAAILLLLFGLYLCRHRKSENRSLPSRMQLSFMMAVAFMYVVYNVFIAFTRPEAADFASRYYSFALLLLFLLLWYAIDRLSRYVNVGTSVSTVLPLLFLVLAVSVGVFTQRRNLVEYTYLQDHNAISALKQYDTLDTILYESSTHVSYECVSLRPWNTALSPVNSTDSTPPEALPDQFLFWTGLDNTENQVMHELLQRGYSVEHLCDTHISSVYHCHNA